MIHMHCMHIDFCSVLVDMTLLVQLYTCCGTWKPADSCAFIAHCLHPSPLTHEVAVNGNLPKFMPIITLSIIATVMQQVTDSEKHYNSNN